MVKLYETAVAAIQTGDLQKWQEAQRLQLIGECFCHSLGILLPSITQKTRHSSELH